MALDGEFEFVSSSKQYVSFQGESEKVCQLSLSHLIFNSRFCLLTSLDSKKLTFSNSVVNRDVL